MTIARAHRHLIAKSKTVMYSTYLDVKKSANTTMDVLEKSKIRNVRGCVSTTAPAVNELKNESIKTLVEIEYEPAKKLMQNCIVT